MKLDNMDDCIFCNPEDFGYRKLEIEDEKGYWYAVVPKEIGAYGQLLLITTKLDEEKRHITDITDPLLLKNEVRILSILKGISEISSKLKTKLVRLDGKKVEKIYVVTQCEGCDSHLHFHLYPKFEHDLNGNQFLYSCELTEARWQDPPHIDPKKRITEGKDIIQKFKVLIDQNKFIFKNDYKEKTLEKMVMQSK